MVTGWRCAVCETFVPVATPFPWRCPNATASDRHHVLLRVPSLAPMRPADDPNPLVAFDAMSNWAAFADVHGMGLEDRAALVRSLDAAVAAVDGTGFRITPFERAGALSDALGFARDGGVWVKDETGNVAGSHKARHLAGILLHLLAAERLGLAPATRSPLAIASCGNAALAAATLARSVDWPLLVFVPTWADPWILARLGELGASVVTCPRLASDPPGDPCVHRFRSAVADGAVPFVVQGPENALSLDTGRTIGWEMIEGLGHFLDRIVVQVGGGALAACVALAAADAGIHPRLHAVQAAGCAPLARAWDRATHLGLQEAPRRWAECMWPWEPEPRSLAEGILDDETYDWVAVVQGMAASGGWPVVASEAQIAEALDLARRTTGIPVSATGTAGLAGLLALRPQLDPGERVAVAFTGRTFAE